MEHIARVHLKEEPYECPICHGKSYGIPQPTPDTRTQSIREKSSQKKTGANNLTHILIYDTVCGSISIK